MNVEKLPSGSYRIRQTYRGKKIYITFPYKPSAKEIALRLAERMEEIDEQNIKGTFKEYAVKYIENRSNVVSPSTIRTYNGLIDRTPAALRNKNIYDITQDDIQVAINEYAKDHAPKSVRSLHGFISSVMKSCRPSFKLSTTLPQKDAKRQYLPTEKDIKAILEASEGTEDHIGFQLGILGLRRAEICALQLSDLKDGMLTINKNMVYDEKSRWIIKPTTKTDASTRVIPLPERLVKEIEDRGYFYKYSPQKLNKHLQDYQDKLNIPRFKFHSLRHYFASYAHSLGICDADIMAMGGWKSDYVMKSVYRESMMESQQKSAMKIAESIL